MYAQERYAHAFRSSHLRARLDLTHSFNAQTVCWPTSTKTFEHPQQSYGKTPGGWFYSSYELSTPEHGGTHLDAPIHFGEGKETSDQIPLTRLVARAVVIDVSAKKEKASNAEDAGEPQRPLRPRR